MILWFYLVVIINLFLVILMINWEKCLFFNFLNWLVLEKDSIICGSLFLIWFKWKLKIGGNILLK